MASNRFKDENITQELSLYWLFVGRFCFITQEIINRNNSVQVSMDL